MDKLRSILFARPMWRRGVAVTLGALASATPAQADVLEIGTDGAHWLAGGPVAQIVSPAIPANPVMLAEVRAAGVPDAYSATVADLCTRYDLSPALLEALVWQESRWRHASISPKGARGLAQLMPATARELGVNPDDPHANLEGGARYLRMQLNRFDGNLEKALAAYNAGPGRVERAGGIPRIRETQHYVASIMRRLSAHYRNRDNGQIKAR